MSLYSDTFGGAAAGNAAPAARLDTATFASFAAFADLAAVAAAAGVAEIGYNLVAHGWFAIGAGGLRLAGLVALAFTLVNMARRRYGLRDYLDLDGHARRAVAAWNLAFMVAALLGFLERGHDDVSRGAYVTFYFVGLLFVMAARAGLVTWARHEARAGVAEVARALLVGAPVDIESPARREEMRDAGLTLVRAFALADEAETRTRQLNEAVRFARRNGIGAVVVAAPIGRGDLIEACVAAFHESPIEVRLKLSPASPQSQLAAARLGAAIGSIGLNRAGQALTDADRFIKRACDLVVGAVALVVLAPVMAAVAIAIKLDSPGPVFFVQTRRGYNKQLFRIIKFRTMTAIENGRKVAQAKARDCRVTRMGNWMRRYNVDELPQLINVLKGEMSLVGPRPHAIPHDRQFAREVPFYTRRTTVMPGMTGWAQVNGHRGAIDTFEHIERRVEHDLHYIDNWSPLFDLWILAMTLFSRNAYRNAF